MLHLIVCECDVEDRRQSRHPYVYVDLAIMIQWEDEYQVIREAAHSRARKLQLLCGDG